VAGPVARAGRGTRGGRARSGRSRRRGRAPAPELKETDLYLPVKRLLESRRYEVKAEVHHCDVLAVREGEPPVIVELKLSLNLDVVMQAVERLTLTTLVYIGIPRSCGVYRRRRTRLLKLLRRLGVGLVIVETGAAAGSAKVLLEPGEHRRRTSAGRRKRLLGEFHRRAGDPNLGGAMTKTGIVTAYRQRAVAIAALLAERGPTKAAKVAEALAEPKARDYLYRNVYGWFERAGVGVYQLSPQGRDELLRWPGRTDHRVDEPSSP